MFEALVTDILARLLGKYVKGLNKENLKIGVWSGDVELQNLQLQREVLDLLDIPLSLRFGTVGELSLSVPWKNLGSAPVVLRLKGITAVVGPRPVVEVRL